METALKNNSGFTNTVLKFYKISTPKFKQHKIKKRRHYSLTDAHRLSTNSAIRNSLDSIELLCFCKNSKGVNDTNMFFALSVSLEW